MYDIQLKYELFANPHLRSLLRGTLTPSSSSSSTAHSRLPRGLRVRALVTSTAGACCGWRGSEVIMGWNCSMSSRSVARVSWMQWIRSA